LAFTKTGVVGVVEKMVSCTNVLRKWYLSQGSQLLIHYVVPHAGLKMGNLMLGTIADENRSLL